MSETVAVRHDLEHVPLAPPSRTSGIFEVFRRRYLLRLMVRREIQAKYAGTGFGLGLAIARAIVNDPAIVIADEPTGNLDPDTSWGIMDIFQRINGAGTTIVMATHDKTIVDTMKKRVIAIEDGCIVRDEAQGGYGYED